MSSYLSHVESPLCTAVLRGTITHIFCKYGVSARCVLVTLVLWWWWTVALTDCFASYTCSCFALKDGIPPRTEISWRNSSHPANRFCRLEAKYIFYQQLLYIFEASQLYSDNLCIFSPYVHLTAFHSFYVKHNVFLSMLRNHEAEQELEQTACQHNIISIRRLDQTSWRSLTTLISSFISKVSLTAQAFRFKMFKSHSLLLMQAF